LLEEALPQARELSRFRTAEAAAVPECAQPLWRLRLLLDSLFNVPPTIRPPQRRPKRTMMTASRALRDGAVDTWSASVEQLATDPR
jgi:hypothetical protein